MKFYAQILQAVIAFFALDAESTEAEVHDKLSSAGTLEDMRNQISQEYADRIAALEGQVADLTAKLDAAEAENTSLKSGVAVLEGEIEVLKRQPAASHSDGDKEAAPAGQEKPWLKLAINQRAASARKKAV